jgi:hypothetical protein
VNDAVIGKINDGQQLVLLRAERRVREIQTKLHRWAAMILT